MFNLLQDRMNTTLLGLALTGLIGGLLAGALGNLELATVIWIVGVVPVLLALVIEIVRSLARGEVGLDIVAALSMSAALLFGETLAAAVVALMYSGGTFLESFAEGRARRAMSDLLSRVPRTATRYRDGGLEDVGLDDIDVGDLLLIRQGDVAPVDGVMQSEGAMLDQSALTGESLPVRLTRGQDVMSGSTNAGDSFDLRAMQKAAESTYAGIVRLVEEAQASKAPMARMADRYSLLFLVITVVLAGTAWLFTGDPIRAVAVLVVATPCPLILAVPVALVAGISRAAHFGVLIKGAKPLEALARVKSLVLDKTGTLTDGRPKIARIETVTAINPDDMLRLAASLEQASKHPMARALVQAAHERGLVLAVPTNVTELPGEGLSGLVEGRRIAAGGVGFVAQQTGAAAAETQILAAGSALVAVAIDGQPVGHIIMADALRSGTGELLAGLRRLGVQRIQLATGDRKAVADEITAGLDLDAVRSDLTPQQKVALVSAEHGYGPVMMVGDGVNDAPALAVADVGVAMGARGAAASAEAADVVLLVDHLDRLLPGIEIAQRARGIALQSVAVGIGLSVAGMIAAAFGYLTPVQGALIQEAIDVAVILNALRALNIRPRQSVAPNVEPAAARA